MRIALFPRSLLGARLRAAVVACLPRVIEARFARASPVAGRWLPGPPETDRSMTPRTRRIHAALGAAIARRQSP